MEYLQCVTHFPRFSWVSSIHLLHLFIPCMPTSHSCNHHLHVWFQLFDWQLIISSLTQILFKSKVLLLSLIVITMSQISKCDRKSPTSVSHGVIWNLCNRPGKKNSTVAFSIGWRDPHPPKCTYTLESSVWWAQWQAVLLWSTFTEWYRRTTRKQLANQQVAVLFHRILIKPVHPPTV